MLQLAHEHGIGHLRAIAGDDEIEQLFDLRTIGQQDQVDTRDLRASREDREVRGRDRMAVIIGPCRLAFRDRLEEQ